MDICRVIGCTNDTGHRGFRCDEHRETCLAEGCTTVSEAVRCSKHAARKSRLGHSALRCKHVGCGDTPEGDRATCAGHAREVSGLQRELDAAYALLAEHGTVTFTR